jgi:GDP-L-fucose synthase
MLRRLAKKTPLMQAQPCRQQYGFTATVNLYGPRDTFDPARSQVIPVLTKNFVDAIESGAPRVEVLGTGLGQP